MQQQRSELVHDATAAQRAAAAAAREAEAARRAVQALEQQLAAAGAAARARDKQLQDARGEAQAQVRLMADGSNRSPASCCTASSLLAAHVLGYVTSTRLAVVCAGLRAVTPFASAFLYSIAQADAGLRLARELDGLQARCAMLEADGEGMRTVLRDVQARHIEQITRCAGTFFSTR